MDRAARVSRLESILRQFPCPRRALDLGCGDDNELASYLTKNCIDGAYKHAGAMLIVGVDRDSVGLRAIQRRNKMQPLQADLAALPFSHQAVFDLILVRHPDIDRSREQWESAFARLPALLCSEGILVITTYSAAEIEQIHRWLTVSTLTDYSLRTDQLMPPDLAGRDRFVVAFTSVLAD